MTRDQTRQRSTDRLAELAAFVERFHGKHGYGPTLREMQAELGVTSPNAIVRLVRSLVESGQLMRSDGSRRSLIPVKRPAALPLLGLVAAGSLRPAFEAVESIAIDSLLCRADAAAVVEDDSLLADGIRRGDAVLLRGGKRVGVVRILK